MTTEWAYIAVAGLLAITAGIIKFVPRKNNPGHNNKYVRKELCDVLMKNITEDLTEIKADVKTLLGRR